MSAAIEPEQIDVYASGKDGYAFYRIPAAVVTPKGTVLAFCEGRKIAAGDAGHINTLLRRSSDGGRTWSDTQVVWSDGDNTCGNPAPVIDRDTGRIWLFGTWNLGSDSERMIEDGVSTDTRRVFVSYSDDDGINWTQHQEITASVKRSHWRWYATGPCHGIQLSNGRLVMPANHTDPSLPGHPSHSHVILSDDHGKTWRIGGVVDNHTNESTAAEIGQNGVYLNMRSYRGLNRRAVAWSKDGGETWTESVTDQKLIEPVCQASVLRHVGPAGEIRYFFSNPANMKRTQLTIRRGDDYCRTWSDGRLLHAGMSAYSDLCSVTSDTVGCLYERDADGKSYGRITFARMPMEWLLGDDAPTTLPITSDAKDTKSMRPDSVADFAWEDLPALPDPHGVAGPFVGHSGKALIAAGGANFPNGKPWEGGKKVWHDTVYVLSRLEASWTTATFRLSKPAGYGVSVTTKEGLLCIGGDNESSALADVFLLKLAGKDIVSEPYPSLPTPLTQAAGVMIGDTVYVMGGATRIGATTSTRTFLALDLKDRASGWRELPAWPGPGRILPVAAAVGNAVYLMSGAELAADADGKPVRTYLRDAWRYAPTYGWTRLADLPRPAVAAPSPAMRLGPKDFLIIGGDDGSLAGTKPGADHPGFKRTTLRYDLSGNKWVEEADSAPLPPVTTPAVTWRGRYVLASGEIRPGVRTPTVRALKSRPKTESPAPPQ